MKERLRVYAVSLGISFGIMGAYVNSLEALAIVFVLVTASVVAASIPDLKELERDKGLLGFAILCAIFTFGIAFYTFQIFADVFVVLVTINVATLVGYVVMKHMPRYNSDIERSSFESDGR